MGWPHETDIKHRLLDWNHWTSLEVNLMHDTLSHVTWKPNSHTRLIGGKVETCHHHLQVLNMYICFCVSGCPNAAHQILPMIFGGLKFQR